MKIIDSKTGQNLDVVENITGMQLKIVDSLTGQLLDGEIPVGILNNMNGPILPKSSIVCELIQNKIDTETTAISKEI